MLEGGWRRRLCPVQTVPCVEFQDDARSSQRRKRAVRESTLRLVSVITVLSKTGFVYRIDPSYTTAYESQDWRQGTWCGLTRVGDASSMLGYLFVLLRFFFIQAIQLLNELLCDAIFHALCQRNKEASDSPMIYEKRT